MLCTLFVVCNQTEPKTQFITMSSDTLKDLRGKRKELQDKKTSLQQKIEEIDNRLSALDQTIELFEPEKELQRAEKDKIIPHWPSGDTMPERVSHVLEHIDRVMQPHEVDEYVRENSSESVRDNAVAETLSRLARQDKIARKDYGQSSSYYGLKAWYSEEEDDFEESVKPEGLSAARDLLSQE